MNLLLVFVGAGSGGVLRYALGLAVLRLGLSGHLAAPIVNIVGSFLMGALVAYLVGRSSWPEGWRLLLATGFLGGFTTFSAFSLDAVLLYERGQPGVAAAYVIGSVVLSIAALFAGLVAVRAMTAA